MSIFKQLLHACIMLSFGVQGSAGAAAETETTSPTVTIRSPVEAEGPIVRPLDKASVRLGRVRVGVGRWHNNKNRLGGRPVVATLDLGRAYPVRDIRLVCSPSWKSDSLSRARLEVASGPRDWKLVAEEKGPGQKPSQGPKERFEMAGAPKEGSYRYVRATVIPQASNGVSVSRLEVVLGPLAEVQRGIRRLEEDLAFYEPDSLDYGPDLAFYEPNSLDYGPGSEKGPGSYVKAYFHNRTARALKVQGLYIAGVSLDKHLHKAPWGGVSEYASIWIDPDEESQEFQKLLAAGEPVWYKVEPSPLPPGTIGELTLRLRHQPKNTLQLELKTSGPELKTIVEPERPPIDVLYATCTKGLQEVLLYTRCWDDRADPISRLLVDGVDRTEGVMAHQDTWLARVEALLEVQGLKDSRPPVAAFRISLPEPFERGSFHTVALVTASGKVFRTQVRAWNNPFLIAGMGPPRGQGPERYLETLKRLNFNAVIWFNACEELHAKHGIMSIPRPENCPTSPNVLGYYGLDEPDVKDHFADVIQGSRWRRPGVVAWHCLQERRAMQKRAPQMIEMLVCDSTFYGVNFATYAQLSDLPACNPYAPRLKPNRGLRFVTGPIMMTAAHAEPKPSFALLLCSSNPKKYMRDPSYEEELLMVSYSLAGGAKGIGYYWWPRLRGNDELIGALGKINARLEQVGFLAAKSIPTGWAETSSEKTAVEALWAAGEGVVVLVTNEDYKTDPSKNGTTIINAQRNVKISCRLPEGAEEWELFRVTPVAWEPVSDNGFAVEEGDEAPRMTWTMPQLDVAEWYVIAPTPY